jgi:hypothetical protein
MGPGAALPGRDLTMRAAALLAAFWLSTSPGRGIAETKDERAQRVTRSIYVPVEITLCGHLSEAVLYEDGIPVNVLPAKRIAQFTYYPELSRVEPSRSELRVEGLRADGSRFYGKLEITPWGVFTAGYRIELDLKEQLEKMKFQLDVRYHTVHVRMRCLDSCGRAVAAGPSTRSVHEQ